MNKTLANASIMDKSQTFFVNTTCAYKIFL